MYRLILLLILPIMSLASPFVVNKDYKLIEQNSAHAPQGALTVVEFFNYGCPWCYRFEPRVNTWLTQATKRSNIQFSRVAVVFHEQWRAYARAYYTASALGVAHKVNLPLFKAIQEQNKTLQTAEAFADFLSAYGVNKDDFINAYKHSPMIDIYTNQGVQLTRHYQITGVPSFVVAGKYKTDSRMAGGDAKKLLAIVDYLITLSQAKKVTK
jgi:protein dithiol oxidoreductase (disulfide-forming)